MLRVCTISLLLLLFVAPVVRAQNGGPCYPCRGPEFSYTNGGQCFNAGLESLCCSDLTEIASQRPDFTDVCFIVQGYALQFCGCQDAQGNAPDPLPFVDDAPPWYV